MARRELEDLRAAIIHHRREGLCNAIVDVVLPPKPQPRERWLTRSEAARLIWAAWRYREVQKGSPTDSKSRQHVARFILVGLYSGTRLGGHLRRGAATPTEARVSPTSTREYSIGRGRASRRRTSASRLSGYLPAPRPHAALARQGHLEPSRDRVRGRACRQRQESVRATSATPDSLTSRHMCCDIPRSRGQCRTALTPTPPAISLA